MHTKCSLVMGTLKDLPCCRGTINICFNPMPEFSIEAPSALREAITVCSSPSLGTISFFKLGLHIAVAQPSHTESCQKL